MNDLQEDQLSMYEAVLEFSMDPAWTTLIGSVPDLENAFAQIAHLLTPVTGGSTGQGSSTQQGKGATTDKKGRKNALVDVIIAVSGPLSAHGAATGDNEIIAVADTSAARLRKLRDGILGSRATSIHTLATAHAAALVPKGVTAATLNALTTFTGNWTAQIQRPRQHKAQAAARAVEIKNGLKALDALVKKQIDKMMLPFRASAPSFYAAYQASRVIHNTAAKKKAPAPPPPGP